MISQYLGAKNTKKVEQVVHVLFMFAFIGGGLITLAGIGLAPFFSNLMNVPLDIFDMCVNYLRIYFLGTVFSFLLILHQAYYVLLEIQKDRSFYLMISSILNIALDFLFVAKLKMGVFWCSYSNCYFSRSCVHYYYGTLKKPPRQRTV